MTPEEKEEIRAIFREEIRQEMIPVNEILSKHKNLIENDDSIGHRGLASRFADIEEKVQKIENIKNAAVWVMSGLTAILTLVFNLLSDWFKDVFVK